MAIEFDEIGLHFTQLNITDCMKYPIPGYSDYSICKIDAENAFIMKVKIPNAQYKAKFEYDTYLDMTINNIRATIYMQYFIERLLIYFMDQLPYSFSPVDIDIE